MNDEFLFSLIFVLGVLVASISQIILKKSANTNGASGLKAYFNTFVISAYVFFIVSTFVSLMCLRYIPLSRAPVLDATGYIFVAILSRIYLGEKLQGKKVIGFILIFVGIIIGSI